MKKQLLSIVAALAVVSVDAQSPSPQWTINQQAVFPSSPSFTAQGIKFLDAVDTNVIWTIGMDWAAPGRNYNWYSRSVNGGATFTGGNVFPDTNTYQIANMEGIDANTAWVASFMKGSQSQGAIHRTTNGGATWVNMTATGMYTNATAFTNIVSFLTPSIGITQGDPVNGEFEIWRTTDGGLSWTQIPGSSIPNPLSSAEFAIVDLYAKLGTSNIWFGTNAGRMYRSTDAGLTWSVATVGASTDVLLEIAFTTPLLGITYVSNGSSIDVYNTTDGGATWTKITPVGNIGYADIKGIPGTGMYASFGVGNANAYLSYSSDNGLTWTDWGSSNIWYITGDFVDGKHGWAGSYDFPSNPFYTNVWKYSGASISGTVAPTSAFTLPPSLCLTGSSVTANANNSSAGSPLLNYSWTASPAGVLFSSTTSSAPVMSFTATGIYTVYLTVTNNLGANTSQQIVNVQACSPPAPSFSAPTTGCTNLNIALVNTSTGGSPAPSYSWSASGNVNFSPSPVASSPTITAATAGVYTIYLTGTNSQGSVQATQTINVVSCAPAVSFTMPEIVLYCDATNSLAPKPKFVATNNTTVHPEAGANSYTWSIAPSTSIQATPPQAVNYTVTVRHPAISVYTVTLRARNNSGTSVVSQTIAVDLLCVGVEENGNILSDMLVYPNPANEKVNVTVSENGTYKLKIINVLGAVIFEDQLQGSEEKSINVSEFPKGVYFLSVETPTGKGSRKLIIE